jgi:hypothetical protein
MYPARRAARYSGGIGDAIIEMAIAPVREAIEADMKARTDAVEREYYESNA